MHEGKYDSMENHSIKIADVNGDLIGAGVSGIGNFVGREIRYTVKNNVFNINNPSTDSLSELGKYCYFQTKFLLIEIPIQEIRGQRRT